MADEPTPALTTIAPLSLSSESPVVRTSEPEALALEEPVATDTAPLPDSEPALLVATTTSLPTPL
jgi:hypothetical protein